MKQLYGFIIVVGLAFIPTACSNNYPTGPYSSGGYMRPTPTPGPGSTAAVTVGVTNSAYTYQYNPSTITLTKGQAILWDSTNMGHTLNIDNGSGSCLVSGQTSFPYTYTFSVSGSYHFHCGIHSTCANGTCPNPSTCMGMVGMVTVN